MLILPFENTLGCKTVSLKYLFMFLSVVLFYVILDIQARGKTNNECLGKESGKFNLLLLQIE